jgi:hAT family C-terminal dimerisation region
MSIFPKLSKMARDVYAVPASNAGVEREFNISGRLITKQRNRLNPATIRDLMQYKRWVARHGTILEELVDEDNEADEIESEILDIELEENEPEVNKELIDWLKNWEKKERLVDRTKRLAQL